MLTYDIVKCFAFLDMKSAAAVWFHNQIKQIWLVSPIVVQCM